MLIIMMALIGAVALIVVGCAGIRYLFLFWRCAEALSPCSRES